MENRVAEIAQRIKGLREMIGKTDAHMAEVCGCGLDDYRLYEDGGRDFTFSFLYKVADELCVDITELITGEAPNLTAYTVERDGQGVPINRRVGFNYLHKSAYFKNRKANPFVVIAPFDAKVEDAPIKLSKHSGQEFDFILEGVLKVEIDGHIEILRKGDSVYYDSGRPHGMVATDGADCKFLAVVFD